MWRSKRHKRQQGEAERRSFPRSLIALGAVAAAVLGYVGARGGPGLAWQEIEEAAGYVRPPRIVSLEPRKADGKRFVVSIENPSLRRVQVTGYEAVPAIQTAAAIEPAPGAGSLPVMEAEEERPSECTGPRRVSLPTPLVIEGRSSGGLALSPWNEACDFSFRVNATCGTSRKAYWSPRTEAMLWEMKRTNQQIFEVMVRSASPDFQEHLRHKGLAVPGTPQFRGRNTN
jgi:hypothetical protein